MVNGLILKKIKQQTEIIESILNKYLKVTQNTSKGVKDISKIKKVSTIQTHHTRGINAMCLLKDNRLVSGSGDKSIIVYDRSYQLQLHIKDAHKDEVASLYALANEGLVSSSNDTMIKIWKIGENDYKLIHTLKGHALYVWKVIELKDGQLCSCSGDKTIRIWDDKTYQSVTALCGHTKGITTIIEMNNYIISVSPDTTMRIWDVANCECIQKIEDIDCYDSNGLSKLNDNTVLVGGKGLFYIVNIETYKVRKIKDELFGRIHCFKVIRNYKLLFTTSNGEICCYDLILDQLTALRRIYKNRASCLIGTEDNRLILSSYSDIIINIYK